MSRTAKKKPKGRATSKGGAKPKRLSLIHI